MSVADFYDQLSPFYPLIYASFHAGVERQASQLDGVIRELWGAIPHLLSDDEILLAFREMRSRYYAVPVVRLLELMTEAGVSAARRTDDRFFQPLLAGFKPA